ncbi:MAG: hypothetical protein U9N48_04785 [Euryarchaeota archaeon]|nr:hypothetical protein [Euryarchaeota archaeon]
MWKSGGADGDQGRRHPQASIEQAPAYGGSAVGATYRAALADDV